MVNLNGFLSEFNESLIKKVQSLCSNLKWTKVRILNILINTHSSDFSEMLSLSLLVLQ